ncbi:protein kinase domain-containing protein [Photobacterium nomapromontoriensis]|uniref:protein kinase domain-containing protein n=1 Tax=Photobacterium nomapromontoriensis TaxID=2910237 RepID=UPI003D0EDAAA
MAVMDEVLVNSRYSLRLSVGGYSSAGHRSTNQDAFAVKQPACQSEYSHKGVVACIADGVSCSELGQQASHTTVTQFISEYYATPQTWGVKQSASKVLNALNQWFYHHGRQRELTHNGMVSTFCTVVIKSNTAHIMHVGDSRVSLFRKGKLTPLTRDHRRHQFGHQYFLTRALGMDTHLEVDYQQLRLETGDRLILTTDGVHEWVNATAMADQLSCPSLSLEHQAQSVVESALAQGSQDNSTCLILGVDALPEMGLDEMVGELVRRAIPPVMAVGNQLDQYKIIRILHCGARSHVYLAVSDFDGREYVLKVPSLNYAEDYHYLQGFVREGWIGEQLTHARLMKIHPFSHTSSFLYHVCDWVDGVTLRQWMNDNPYPELEQIRRIGCEIVKAVRVLQRHGIVHRDLKPENLMMNSHGQIVIIDFGTVWAKSFQDVPVVIDEPLPVGDTKYMAPECLAGTEVSTQSDLFSIAVILYEMLSGHYPYAALSFQHSRYPSSRAMIYQPLSLYRDDLPAWLDLVISKACHPMLSQRYQALSEFSSDLYRPSEQLLKQASHLPFKKKAPVVFWKLISLFLFGIILLQALWF